MRRRAVLGYGAAGMGALAVTLLYGWWRVDGPGAPETIGQPPIALSAMDFRLVDHEGNRVRPKSLIGRPTMVFFGFTYCPDVCPTTLSDISGWLGDLGEDHGRMNVIFISVDPERDTVDAMAEYVASFHSAIRGWTGPPEQIARAAESFRVTYEKIPIGSEDYTMNHTASVFLFNTDGTFVSTIDYHEVREVAVAKIRRSFKKKI